MKPMQIIGAFALIVAGCTTRRPPEPPPEQAHDSSPTASERAVESPAEESSAVESPSAPSNESQAASNSQSAEAPSTPYDVAGWDRILSTYVTNDGGFRYEALRANEEHRAQLASFAETVAESEPDSWSRDVQLAFYINAYNALVIKSVLDLWPIRGVMTVRGFFDRREHRVAGQSMTLNHLENEIIRSERFAEPRIHFLVNCASVGCPPLMSQAVTAENLEESLAREARAFVRSSSRIETERNRVRLSQIFEWFGDDFSGVGGVREFVASQLDDQQATFVRTRTTRIGHFQYDWALNRRE